MRGAVATFAFVVMFLIALNILVAVLRGALA